MGSSKTFAAGGLVTISNLGQPDSLERSLAHPFPDCESLGELSIANSASYV